MTTNIKILVVEDESIVAQHIQSTLKKLGYALAGVAFSGEEAVQKALEAGPDLVLMDIRLKGDIDGIEASRQIHNHLDIPVVYLTAHSDEATLGQAKVTAPFGFILKPFDSRDLHTTIQIALYKHKLDKELRESEERYRRLSAELQALYDISLRLNAQLDTPELLQLIVKQAVVLLEADAGCVYIYDSQSDELVLSVAVSFYKEYLGTRLKPGEGLSGKAFESGRSIIVEDYTTWAGQAAIYEGETRTRATLAVPLRGLEGMLGVLDIGGGEQKRAFDEHDRWLAELFAAQASVAMENARLYAKEQEQFRLLQESQAKLIQAAKMSALGRLIASIAHEINNPLQAMQGQLELALEEIGEDDIQRGQLKLYIDMAENEVDRVANIVRRMRDFYRPAREGMRPTDLHAVLDSVLALSGKQLQHSQINIVREWADDLPLIPANPDHLKQVFLNLVLNAIDAMATSGGTLYARTRPGQMQGRDSQWEAAVRIELTDTGEGMPPEVMNRLFEPFFTTKSTGTGLGLSISYGIIEAHGGQIMATSQVGAGTTFTILLPLEERMEQLKETSF